MNLCRNEDGYLFLSEYPKDIVIGTYENEQQALIAMQLWLSSDIKDCLTLANQLF